MRLEDLQATHDAVKPLRPEYTVLWNGTRDSASGTPYLASDETPADPGAPPYVEPVAKFRSALRSAVVDTLSTRGPMTIRALTDHLHGSHEAVKQCVYNMVKGGYLVDMGKAVAPDKKFGRGQPPKLFGIAS